MKRNQEARRRICLKAEESERGISALDFPDLDPGIVNYQMELLWDEGKITGKRAPGSDGERAQFDMVRLTSAGHDYLDSIRDN